VIDVWVIGSNFMKFDGIVLDPENANIIQVNTICRCETKMKDFKAYVEIVRRTMIP
jgi:hypothetical protein